MVRPLLRSAAERARALGHPILASVKRAIPHHDPADVFAAARAIAGGSCFYWEQPAQATAYVGIGAAATLTAVGDSSITEVASLWRVLLEDAVIATVPETPFTVQGGPICFGGFAFDPAAPRTPLWEGFPDGLLVLPELLISSSTGESALTANLLIEPSDDDAALERHADALDLRLLRLRAALERQQREQRSRAAASHTTPHDLRPASEWMSLVDEVSHEIRDGLYQKVVLARGVEVSAEMPFDVQHALHRLRAAYPAASIFVFQRGQRCFLCATPERLARVVDSTVHTIALAGTAPRGASDADDHALGEALLHSEKNRREHAIVVETIRRGIAPLVSSLDVAQSPHLLRLANVQHLQTPITGTLIPGKTILDLVAALHPTPAVGGFPRDAAMTVIREREQLDRGWYAGPTGWIGPGGDGEFAVALRSALVDGDHATLFAGCGIVADSEPQREYEESCLKLRVMLDALRGAR
ncbi:MAG TPA: isochorismate synthase [Ktedonobacterales bacterium]